MSDTLRTCIDPADHAVMEDAAEMGLEPAGGFTGAQAPHHQEGLRRIVTTSPIGRLGTGVEDPEPAQLAELSDTTVMMMGVNPDLPPMPDKPTLIDFFHQRFCDITFRHLLNSAKHAMDEGLEEKVVMACLLHDISNGCMLRPDHGYWGAQMIAPYVSEEIAWAVKYHQPLRYFADESVGYDYPASYYKFFGKEYVPPAYIKRDAEIARNHKWYMTSRQITLHDIYILDNTEDIQPEIFTDLIGRHFKQPEEGLGFDDTPASHMWRTMIFPNNFL